MIRLYTVSELAQQKQIFLQENQIHYLLHVMRQKEGDNLLLFNGKDGEWLGEISSLTKKKSIITIKKQTREQQPQKELILCPALIKKENMDLVFQKATELGVSQIYPLITDRTVVSKLNLDRAQSILIEAAEQSERLTIPEIHKPQKLEQLLKILEGKNIICLAERGQTSNNFKSSNPALFIGPEGGWTTSEIALFQTYQSLFWHLGNNILRAETASIAALACIQFK